MAAAPPVVLTIAGFDPSSGAGITADIKTFAAHGCYGVASITAETVQSPTGAVTVQRNFPWLLTVTCIELARDFEIAAVKIGMLATADNVKAVAGFLANRRTVPSVLDPVIRSTSGSVLLDSPGVNALRELLLPLCTVITPNVDEAAALSRIPVTDLASAKLAATRLHELGAANVVVTGGHLASPCDLLSTRLPDGSVGQQEFPSERLESRSTHGTGCAFSSSLAANLALGCDLPEAVRRAQAYVFAAIRAAPGLGHGIGPLEHFPKKRF
jgi:hydroxymethylpyrimidine/phosphomethylpyrimidine kinase